MRLFEAIIDANHRALSGDASAALHPADFADELPVAALTCIDARLNPLLPGVLGLPKEQFIWLRNAGNIITGPLSSTMRSLALACAVKGAREIAVIGHTDCLVCKTSTMHLTEAFRRLGIDRAALPGNLTEYFGLFASERQNVMNAAGIIRNSPLVGKKVPVHGLMVDVITGKLEWAVNGYQTLELTAAPPPTIGTGQTLDALKSLAEFQLGEMKFPETKIGEFATEVKNLVVREIQQIGSQPPEPRGVGPPPVAVPARKIPLPPRLRPSPNVTKWRK